MAADPYVHRLSGALLADDPEVVHDVGLEAAEAGDLESAARAFRVAASYGHAVAFSNLGTALRDLGERAAACVAWESSIALGETENRVWLAVLLLEDPESEARAERLLVAATEDGEPEAAHHLGLLRLRQQRYGEAIAVLDRALEEERSGATLHSMGDALRRGGLPADSLPYYDEAIAAGYDDALLDRAFALDDLHAADRAEAAFQDALRAGVGDASVSLASWLERQGRGDEGLRVLRESAAAGDVSALIDLGNRLTSEPATTEEGLRCYRQAMLLGSREAMTNLAVSLEELDVEPLAVFLRKQAAAEGDRLAAEQLDDD